MESRNEKTCVVCESKIFNPFLICKDHTVSQQDFQLVACKNCGFVFTANAPGEQDIDTYYASEDYISHSNDKRGLVHKAYHLVRQYMLSRKEKLVRELTKGKVGTLLDVGCGTGYFLGQMKRSGWRVTGLEPDPGARKIAEAQFAINVSPPSKLFDLDHHSYDAITLWHVLEHVHNPHNYLSQFHKLLKKDGWMIVALPNHESYDAKHYKEHWAGYDVPRHLWHFAPDTLAKICAANGFELVKKKIMPFDAFYVSILSEKYKREGGNLISGVFHGLISLMKSLGNVNLCSSVIYVLQKKNSSGSS